MFTRVPFVLAALVAATVIASACEPPFPPFPPYDEPPPLKKPKKPVPEAAPFPQVGTVVALDGKEETVEYTVIVPVVVRETIRVKSNHRVTDDGGKTWEPVWTTTTVFRRQY